MIITRDELNELSFCAFAFNERYPQPKYEELFKKLDAFLQTQENFASEYKLEPVIPNG